MAEAFIRFSSVPEAWVRFLRRKGVAQPILGPEGDFYRTQAYQCADVFDRGNGMRRLVESVYAACDCDRETAEGRYGRSALAELPYRYSSPNEEHAAAEVVTKLDLVSVPSHIHFGVGPGLGEVLAAVREHSAFDAMQQALDRMTIVPNPQDYFRSAWSGLAEVTADKLARRMTRRSPVDKAVSHLAVGLYVGARVLGYVVFKAPYELYWPVPLDHMAITRIEHWVPTLSRYVRAALQVPKAYGEWTRAATIRCSTVTLRP